MGDAQRYGRVIAEKNARIERLEEALGAFRARERALEEALATSEETCAALGRELEEAERDAN